MLNESKLYRDIRKFAIRTPFWGTALRYEVKPDEINDLTLISRRVYGNSDEYMAIMASAGLDRADQSLVSGTTLVLPTPSQLSQFKASNGIVPTVIKVR